MYVQSGIPQPTYMPNWMGDMGMPNQSMMYNMPCGMNMKPNMQYQQRPMCSGSSYGSCYSPYGLGRYQYVLECFWIGKLHLKTF